MSKPVTIRFDDTLNQFIESVRGDLTVAETIRNIISYHKSIGESWTRKIISDITRINPPLK